jgi:hypothetical protein
VRPGKPAGPRWRLGSRPPSYMFPTMYWPLVGGFIAFLLIALFLGWILDPERRRDQDGH